MIITDEFTKIVEEFNNLKHISSKTEHIYSNITYYITTLVFQYNEIIEERMQQPREESRRLSKTPAKSLTPYSMITASSLGTHEMVGNWRLARLPMKSSHSMMKN